MKHLILSIAVLFSAQMTYAQVKEKATAPIVKEAVKPAATTTEKPAEQNVEKTNAKMAFESLTLDYGVIPQKSEPLRVVKFTNTGTDPLVIKSAHGSCGCTVPVWPKDPIMPGESSVIEIRYDTNRIGKINKSVTITTNEGPDKHVIQVVGEVLKAEEEMSVPSSTPNVIKGN